MTGKGDPAASYQVALSGELGPTFLSTFAEVGGAGHAVTTSAFLLSVPEAQGIHDVMAMLQARGLVILGIRRVDGTPFRQPRPAAMCGLDHHPPKTT